MKHEARGTHGADDAALLTMVRAGDASAFGTLRQRHERAARRLAGELLGTPADAEDTVAEAFFRVLAATQRGGGPADAFRPYLLTAVRRAARDRLAGGSHGQVLPSDPGELLIDPAAAGSEQSPLARAFLSLPERWIAVLWHTEIEGAGAAEVAPLFGLSRNDVAALRRQARDGLRRACLQTYFASVTRQDCAPVAARLGVFLQDAIPGEDTAMVTRHLSECDLCRAVYAELADIGVALRTVVAPLVLGSAAAAYLRKPDARGIRAERASGRHAADALTAGVVVNGRSAAAASAGPLRGLRQLTQASGPVRWLTAGAAAVAVAAVAAGVALSSQNTSVTGSGSAGSGFVSAGSTSAGSTSAAVVTPQPSRAAVSSAPPPHAGQSQQPSRKPPASASPNTAPVINRTPPQSSQLTAAVSLSGTGPNWHRVQVSFEVSDPSTAATGELTVSLALPAGASLFGGTSGGSGWSCQGDGSQVTCQHAGIPAGGHAQGSVFVMIKGSAACGQPADMTASSGSASADAQSPQVIQC